NLESTPQYPVLLLDNRLTDYVIQMGNDCSPLRHQELIKSRSVSLPCPLDTTIELIRYKYKNKNSRRGKFTENANMLGPGYIVRILFELEVNFWEPTSREVYPKPLLYDHPDRKESFWKVWEAFPEEVGHSTSSKHWMTPLCLAVAVQLMTS
ncbi:hypothetical protein STEG23_020288, partial [Scotinomys teguina]